MPYVNVNVDADVFVDLEDIGVDNMIDFLEKEGYTVVEKGDPIDDYIHIGGVDKLYSTWLTCDGKTFEKELRDFFAQALNKIRV